MTEEQSARSHLSDTVAALEAEGMDGEVNLQKMVWERLHHPPRRSSKPAIVDGVHGPVLAVLGVFVRVPGGLCVREFSLLIPVTLLIFLGPL